MSGYHGAFFGIVRTPLVRKGASEKLKEHYAANVYAEMLVQICMEYASLPDARTLRASEIRFWYEGCRHTLIEGTKPQPGK